MCYFSYSFVTLLSIALLYSMPLSPVTGETTYQPISTGNWVFFTLMMFLILLEYHKYFITTHSLTYKLATIKQSCCFFIISSRIIIPVNKYEFLFHIIFTFLILVCNTYNIYNVCTI